jgi:hypothetical protein
MNNSGIEIKEVIQYIKNGLDILKSLKDLIPSNKKHEIESKLKEAEVNLKEAKVVLAKKLGYKLCQCTFPPEIMLLRKNENKYICEKCGNSIIFSASHLQTRIDDY